MHLVSLEFWYNDQSHLWFKSRMALSLHNLPNGDDVLTSHQSKNQWTSTWNNKKSSITVPLSWPLRLKISRKLIIFNSFSYELICPLQEQLGEASSLFSSVDHFTHSFQNLDSPWISSWLLFLSSLSVHINLVRYFPYFDPAWCVCVYLVIVQAFYPLVSTSDYSLYGPCIVLNTLNVVSHLLI